MREEAIRAIPEHLKTAALQPDYSKFPIVRKRWQELPNVDAEWLRLRLKEEDERRFPDQPRSDLFDSDDD